MKIQPTELRSVRRALKMLHKTNNTEKAECFRFSLLNLYTILSNGKENYRETGRKFINQ